MSLSASSLHPQTIARPLLTLSVTVIGLIVLLPLPAHAKAFGDVVVGPQQTEHEVSTAIGDVTVDGVVQRDVHSGFGNVLVNQDGAVGGNIDAGLGDVEVYGPVGGGVDAGFGNVYIDAPVRGNVEVGRGDVDLGPDGRVYGNVYYGSGEFRGNRAAHLPTTLCRHKLFDQAPIIIDARLAWCTEGSGIPDTRWASKRPLHLHLLRRCVRFG